MPLAVGVVCVQHGRQCMGNCLCTADINSRAFLSFHNLVAFLSDITKHLKQCM